MGQGHPEEVELSPLELPVPVLHIPFYQLHSRAAELAPANVSHLNNYGVILAENGMLAEAKAQWRKVLEIDPDNATARGNLSALER